MYGALVMGLLRGINKTGEDTASVLAMLNKRLLVRPVHAPYCATLYALYDPATRDLSFSNAGIPRPLLVSAAGCRSLGEGGLPSGLFPGSEYETHTVRLAPGDMVLFATDGLHELRNPEREDFCLERIYDVWTKCRGRSAEDSLDFLFDGACRRRRTAARGFVHLSIGGKHSREFEFRAPPHRRHRSEMRESVFSRLEAEK
jgi:serine phosphatase RsbU (regulator of sigma subunit)